MSAESVTDPIVIEVVRNGFVESVHHARLAVTGPDGSLVQAIGDATARIFPRSSSKPLQAVGMLHHGLDVTGEHLALAAASHSGEEFHRAGVEQMLAAVGLDVSALQNTPALPIDQASLHAWLRAGRGPEAVAADCSGKHAAMLVTAVRMGADLATYRDPQHPVQRACHDAIGELTGDAPSDTAVDGCGAPLWSVSLVGLARAYGRLAAATDGPERAVADAFRAHPEWASGTTRNEVALHRAIPGLVCKSGAEAVFGVGLPDGTGIAVKVLDGGARGREAIVATVLQRLGYDHPTLTTLRTVPVLGHGAPVGEVRVMDLDLAGWE